MIIISPLILRSLSLTSVFFDTTVLSSDEPDGQEESKLQYLDQEKLSYIRNYLEQTRDTDVHSLSTEDDSGKAASNSAPSEFGFEETSGMTQSIPRAPNCVNFRNLRAVGMCHQGCCEGYYIGISSWFIQAGKTLQREKTELMLKERVRNLLSDSLKTRIRPYP